MKLFIVGSIKIDSRSRKKMFLHTLISFEPVLSLFSWNINIVGKYSNFCAKEIQKRCPEAIITSDNNSSYYEVVKKQLVLAHDSLLFFWLEDHWFLCPDKNLFLYLLDEFWNSQSEIFRVTHLTEAWDIHRRFYKTITDKPLYKEYLIDLPSRKLLCQRYPAEPLNNLPGILKKSYTEDLLECNKDALSRTKKPWDFELGREKAEEFLTKRSVVEMIPNFHVLREVFWLAHEERAIDARQARRIIKLRNNPRTKIRLWREAIFLLMHPRMLLGRVKRKIIRIVT